MASAKGKRISIGNFSPQVVLQRTFHGDDSSGNKPGLHVNDDNAEKLLRKQTKVLELVQKHSPVRCSDRRRSVFQTSNGSLSSAELAEQYANCIKLSAENVSRIFSGNFLKLDFIPSFTLPHTCVLYL